MYSYTVELFRVQLTHTKCMLPTLLPRTEAAQETLIEVANKGTLTQALLQDTILDSIIQYLA